MPSRHYITDIMTSSRITVRNVDPELSRRIRAIGAARGESLNRTVLHLLRDAAGLNMRRERLERYATWTDEDMEEFTEALRPQRSVRRRYWR